MSTKSSLLYKRKNCNALEKLLILSNAQCTNTIHYKKILWITFLFFKTRSIKKYNNILLTINYLTNTTSLSIKIPVLFFTSTSIICANVSNSF